METRKKLLLFSFIFALFIFLSFSAVFALTEEEQKSLAVSWLSNAVLDKWNQTGAEENALALLALSDDAQIISQGKKALLEKSKNQSCWPKDSCKIKETALALLALNHLGENTEKIQKWLLNQNETPTDIIWYMQIDTEKKESSCSITYDGNSHDITIGEDEKIVQDAGLCLKRAEDYNNYWLRISASCYDKAYSVSCDKSFLVTLLYKKKNSETIYVSSQTDRETADGIIDTKIKSICLKDEQASSCNYEGTAWAAFVLSKLDYEKNLFLPYLIGYADKNEKYLPDSFLYLLAEDEQYSSDLAGLQKQAGYWQASGTNDKYYDTSLALLALSQSSQEQAASDKGKKYILSEQISKGTDIGSWNSNKKDTAFIIYVLWPTTGEIVIPDISCIDAGYSCTATYQCESKNILDYFCSRATDVCCKTTQTSKTCDELKGTLCDTFDKNCDGQTKSSSDSSYNEVCCIGDCVQKTECEKKDFSCKNSCSINEEEKSFGCDSGKVCCGEKTESTNDCENNLGTCKSKCEKNEEEAFYGGCLSSEVCCKESEKKSLLWLWILIIILILAVLLFLFRKKLRFGKGKGSRTQPPTMPPTARPVYPATRPFPRIPFRPAPPTTMPSRSAKAVNLPFLQERKFAKTQSQSPVTIPKATLRKGKTDKELETTLTKLKKITEK